MVTEPHARGRAPFVALLGMTLAACRAVEPLPPRITEPAVTRAPSEPAVPPQEPNPGAGPGAGLGDDLLNRTPRPSPQALRREAHRVVDDWHAAAAVGDAARYLGHMADDAVFLGTDASERWDLAGFRAYVERYMQPGKGWVYVPSERVIVVPEDSDLAWFDERLTSAGYGELRGTGVLRRDAETWRLVHYSMTFTVPNAVAREVVALIRGD